MSVFLVKSFESGRKSFLCANKTMRTLIHRSNKSLKFLFISNSNNFFHSPIVCVTRGQKKPPIFILKYTNSATENCVNCLFVHFKNIILIVFSIHAYIQKYIRGSIQKTEDNVEVPYMYTKVYSNIPIFYVDISCNLMTGQPLR